MLEAVMAMGGFSPQRKVEIVKKTYGDFFKNVPLLLRGWLQFQLGIGGVLNNFTTTTDPRGGGNTNTGGTPAGERDFKSWKKKLERDAERERKKKEKERKKRARQGIK
ncbi:hypothetical protein CANDROIZ_330012 [Candidatus Roizmanbacteria bacterium]|nr:hypothetical protein CANDROIZ_330012 [Candidatus Roizmanbacteria bacterium]